MGQLGQDRPRLVVVEELALASPADPYLTLRALASYTGCSVRWLRDRIKDPHHPLPCYRPHGGKLLVRRSDFDAWMARYRQVGDPEVDRIVDNALHGLR
jgi:excisionase family DNA binding protein